MTSGNHLHIALSLVIGITLHAQSQPCLLQRASGHSGSEMLHAGDPNLDRAWDWTSDAGNSMYYSLNGARPIELTNIQTPFFTPGNPLNLTGSTKDMYPQDGWTLVYRDFGTANDAPALPFFVLYNRYRSILRCMFYNGSADRHTAYKGELRFRSGASAISPGAPDRYSSALFTFGAHPNQSFQTHYDGAKSQILLTSMNVYGGWATFDFIASGYDPDLASRKDDPSLLLMITPIDTTNINLTGDGVMTLDQVLQNSSPGGVEADTLHNAFNAISTGYSQYKSTSSALADVQAWANQNHNKPSWIGMAAAAAGTVASSGTLAPYAIGLAGAISAFIGGSNKGTDQAIPLNFAGKFQFNIGGGLETQNSPIWALNLYLNPGPQMADGYRPLRPIDWGVFNIEKMPEIVVRTDYYWNVKFGPPTPDGKRSPIYQIKTTHSPEMGDAPPIIFINPNCGLQLVSQQIAFSNGGKDRPNLSLKDDNPSQTHHQFPAVSATLPTKFALDGGFESLDMTYILKFRVIDSHLINSDRELLYTKTVAIHTTEIRGLMPPPPN